MSDWRWLKPFAEGKDDLARELRAETDASLKRDPDRWTTKHVADTPDHVPKHTGGGDSYVSSDERRHRGTGRGGANERNEWSQRDYDRARRDYEAQQRGEPGLWRRLGRREREDAGQDWETAARASRETIRQARQAREDADRELRDQERQARDDYRQGRPPPGYKGWR